MKKSPDKGQGHPATWRWTAGPVDAVGEHIELRYGSAREAEYEQWTPGAIIGRPTGGTFPVRWLVDPTEDSDVAVATRRELDFYLVENPQRSLLDLDPWEYAVYHCGTTSNVYSDVHWSYFPQGGSMKSPTVAPKVETVAWPFDEAERDRWYARDESLLLGSPASAFIKRVIGQKHAKRPRRFFGEALVAAKTPHLEGYYCPFKWLTSSRWADRTELAGSDAREFREALERHFPRLGEFQQRAKSAANRLEGLKPVGPDLWLVTDREHLFVEVKLPKDAAAPHQIAGLALLATQLESSMPIKVRIVSLDNSERLFEQYLQRITG